MKQLIEFTIENGNAVVFEVDELRPEGGIDRAARPSAVLERATQTLEAALDSIKPAAEVILKRLTSLSERPSEIEVEFGIKVGAQAGAVIASGTVEANFVVKLKWVREKLVE